MSGLAVRLPVAAPGARIDPAPGDPFADNLDHLRALEHEAKLMLAVAVLRSGAGEGAEADGVTAELRRHFPLLPQDTGLATVRELLARTAAANRRREAASEARGVELHFTAFCAERGLEAGERAVVLLLLMQHTSRQFRGILAGCWLKEGRLRTGIEIGTLLEVLCEDFRDQLAGRRWFSADGTLIREEIVLLFFPADDTTNILDLPVGLHERVARRILGDRNLYHAAFRHVRRERGCVSLDQVVLPDGEKEEVVACVARYLDRRASGDLDRLDAFYGYGTGLALLFHGPSGTGKTMLARAIAARFDREVISLSLGLALERTSLEQLLGAVFGEAEMHGGIVLLDECDDLFANNSRLSQALLLELEKARCVVILATNKPVDLDPALERRIAMRVRFRIPDAGMRLRMWRSLLPENVDLAEDVELAALAERYQFSGGLIKNCLLLAAMQARRDGDGRLVVGCEALERAAALQGPGITGENSLFTQYPPEVSIEGLPLRREEREGLAGAAHAWRRLAAEGLGLSVLVSAAGTGTGVVAAEALAAACGLDVRRFDYFSLEAKDYESWPVDPVTQRKIPPLAYALSPALGRRALTLVVDHAGRFAKELGAAGKREERYDLDRLTTLLRTHTGLFCLVTGRFKPQPLPVEFHLHFALEFPAAEAQVGRWEERLGPGAASAEELRELVASWPMHAGEIDHMARQASILSVVRGGSGRAGIDEVREVIGRYRRGRRSPLLFGMMPP